MSKDKKKAPAEAADPRAIRILTGSAVWRPGECIEFVRPAISTRFLAISSGSLGAVAGLSIFLFLRNGQSPLPLASQALGIFGFAVLGGLTVIIYLQGLYPRREMAFDWEAHALEVSGNGRTVSHPFKDIRNIVLRTGASYAQLDAEFSHTSVRLVETDDHGPAAASLPLGHLGPLAQQLSAALRVPLETREATPEPVTGGRIWKNASPWARLALVVVVATLLGAGFDLLQSSLVGIVLVAFAAVVGIVLPLASGSFAGPQDKPVQDNAGFLLATVFIALLFATLAVALSLLPLTRVGTLVGAAFLSVFIPFCLLVPDMVYSQRSGSMLSGLRILGLRLRLRPVRLLIATDAALKQQALNCPIFSIDSVYACESHFVQGPEDLAQAVKDAAERGEITVLPRVESEFTSAVRTSAESFRGLRHHLIGLVAASLALALCGFFFIATGGPTYMDILFVQRDWVETPATITKTIPGYRSRPTRHEFTYQVGDERLSGACSGSVSLAEEQDTRAMYDRAKPEIAVLVGGMRVGRFPFLPLFLLGVMMLVILPLPMVLGHIVAPVFSSADQRESATVKPVVTG